MSITTQSKPRLASHRGWRLLALFFGELLALKWLGTSVKDARQHGALSWEKELRHQLEQWGDPVRPQMQALSQVNKILPFTNLVLWLAFRTTNHRDNASFLGLAVGGVALLRRLAKAWVHRHRPAVWDKIRPRRTSSFPSGHAADTMGLFAALSCLAWHTPSRRPLMLLGCPFILLVGVSRIVLDKHYPTDVLAGWLSASAWVIGAWSISRQRGSLAGGTRRD